MAICKDHIRNDKKKYIGDHLLLLAMVNNPDLNLTQMRRVFFNVYYRLKGNEGEKMFNKHKENIGG